MTRTVPGVGWRLQRSQKQTPLQLPEKGAPGTPTVITPAPIHSPVGLREARTGRSHLVAEDTEAQREEGNHMCRFRAKVPACTSAVSTCVSM